MPVLSLMPVFALMPVLLDNDQETERQLRNYKDVVDKQGKIQ